MAQESSSLPVLLGFAAVVGIVAAGILYQNARANKKLQLQTQNQKERVPQSSPTRSVINDKVSQIASKSIDPAKTAQEITKIVDEQAQELVKDIREEFSVKYQVLAQEKNKEVENVKREIKTFQDKYKQVEKLYEKVENEKKTTEAVIKGIAEGLVIVNHKGEVLLMNPTAESLLGVKKEKKIGRPLTEGASDEVMISMATETGANNEKTIEFKSQNENIKRVIRSSSAVVQNEDGQTVGMVNILTDVTKQKEVDEIKNKFVSNVTHELRTPIVAMQKSIALLQSQSAGTLNETQANFVNIVARNLGHLSRLVEDLLDIAKVDSGKMRFKIVSARLDKIIADVCDSLETWAKSKNLEVQKEMDKSLPEVFLDVDKITQVLNNLIGNAIKFTPSGGKIVVSLGYDSTGKQVQVSVKDNGVGIAKDNIPKLFGRFQQFGDQQGISGTGLGLSIAKEIIEKHEGKIWVESQEKKGATFIFTLPLRGRIS